MKDIELAGCLNPNKRRGGSVVVSCHAPPSPSLNAQSDSESDSESDSSDIRCPRIQESGINLRRQRSPAGSWQRGERLCPAIKGLKLAVP
jgi:hypothetical protein